jgi:predicted transcriptional regulator
MDNSLTFVLAQLAAEKGGWKRISLESGIPYDTLTKIAQGRVKNPRWSTVQRLTKFFLARAA